MDSYSGDEDEEEYEDEDADPPEEEGRMFEMMSFRQTLPVHVLARFPRAVI